MRAREFIRENKTRPNIETRWDGNFTVDAYIDGKRVGSAEFASDDPEGRYGFYAISVGVDPKYRRMGVATAMYDAATEKFGEIIPSEHQTDDARAFWQSYGREVVGESLNYQGNCTEDDVIEYIFGDATTFAQLVDEYGDEFELDDLVVKYNPEEDVHYFYYKNATQLTESVVAYHGSFDPTISSFRSLTHFGSRKAAEDRLRDKAAKEKLNNTGQVYAVKLDINNPAVIKDFNGIHSPTQFAFALKNAKLISQEEMTAVTFADVANQAQQLIELLKSKGYDGLAYKNKWEDRGHTSYVILDPNQAHIVKNIDEDRMSAINIDQAIARTPPEWQQWIKSLPDQLAKEMIDERPNPDNLDIQFYTQLHLASPQPINVSISQLLQDPHNQYAISNVPQQITDIVNKNYGTKIANSGKVYDRNPDRYLQYAKMPANTASPSVLVNGEIHYGVGRFVAACLRGDKSIKAWDLRG